MEEQSGQNRILFLITAMPLLDGRGASYSRILEYAKSLVNKKGISVYLLSYDYPEDFLNTQVEIIPKVYICGKKMTTKNANSFLTRAFNKKVDTKRRKHFIRNLSDFFNQFDGGRAGLVYPTLISYRLEKEIIKLFNEKSIPVFSERNELNLGIALNKAFPKNVLKKIIFTLNYPLLVWDFNRQDKLAKYYDGNIAISTKMEQYLLKTKKPVIRIPILSDIDKNYYRKYDEPNHSEEINIGYTGSISFKKDGIRELIKAVGILIHEYSIKNIHLNLYGTGNRDTIEEMKKQIVSLKLEKHITFHGSVSIDKIPEILSKQDILVLIRPSNLQTEHGFSTKLAEYLASSVPVLATKVSDNGLYIEDQKNGFLLDKHNASETARKLNTIITKKQYLDKVLRKKAYNTAKKNFSGKHYTDSLVEFLFPNKN